MMDRQVRIPKKIQPCPILEAIVEVRFETEQNLNDAVFGMFYGRIKNEVASVLQLPTTQIPEFLRQSDPNLRHQPTHRLKLQNNSNIHVGPRVVAFAWPGPYVGWDKFSDFSSKYFNEFKAIGIMDSIKRVGVRYINYFQGNIFENIKLKMQLGDAPLISPDIQHRSVHEYGGLKTAISVLSQVTINNESGSLFGSVIDIDSFFEGVMTPDGVVSLVDRLHQEELIAFYNLLSDDYLGKSNPEY